jgi:phosphonate transport system permease protein
VLFLAALGLNPFTAVLAIALPYAGIIGKMFAELIDEAPASLLESYRSLGANRAQLFFLALVPRTMPDLLAYLMYRLETGLRSSAIMGFLGIPTLGNLLRLAFENAHYREVWTYLYVLLLMCICFDLWSAVLRKHLVVRN